MNKDARFFSAIATFFASFLMLGCISGRNASSINSSFNETNSFQSQLRQDERNIAGDCLAYEHLNLIDGTGAPTLNDVTMVFCEGHISQISSSIESIKANIRRVDASGYWAIPGFVDLNTGVLGQAYWSARFQAIRDNQPLPSLSELQAAYKTSLRERESLGFTTIAETYNLIPVMKAVAADFEQKGGPRLVIRGNIIGFGDSFSSTQGGKFDLSNDNSNLVYRVQKINSGIIRENIIMGVGDDLPALPLGQLINRVKKYSLAGIGQLKYGGTTHKVNEDPQLSLFSLRQQREIINVGHKMGQTVATHCSTIEGMRQCAQAGVDLFIHANYVDRPIPQDVLNIIASSGVYCALELPQRGLAIFRENFMALARSGCRIGLQTEGYLEIQSEWLAAIQQLQEAGFTPLDAIRSSSQWGAEALGIAADVGTLEVGKRADVLLRSGDPVADISNLTKIEWVISSGRQIPHGVPVAD